MACPCTMNLPTGDGPGCEYILFVKACNSAPVVTMVTYLAFTVLEFQPLLDAAVTTSVHPPCECVISQ